jgi:phosphorylcholine metabolism protein LicD
MKKYNFSNKKHENVAIKLLQDTIEVLNKYKIDYYLDFGTLLGAIRDKKLIPWDNDIDISLYKEKDYKKIDLVLKKLSKKYKTKTVTFEQSINNRIRKSKEIFVKNIDFTNVNNIQIARVKTKNLYSFLYAKGVLDIFFKYEYNNFLYLMSKGKVFKFKKDILDSGLIEIEFYGKKCKVPKNYDEYLTAIYGNWSIKDKNWDKDLMLNKKERNNNE